MGLVSSYPVKFSASTTVTMASSLKAPFVSRSRSLIWNARVAGKADPLADMTATSHQKRKGQGRSGASAAHEDSMKIRSGLYLSVIRFKRSNADIGVKSITSNFKKGCFHLPDENTTPRNRP